MRKRKLGTVDSPFVHVSDASSSDCTDSESKRLCTALIGRKVPKTFEYIHWTDGQVASYLSSNGFDKNVCASFKGTKLNSV